MERATGQGTSAAGAGGLSAEQIRRMEENRRRAQERLSHKRSAAASTVVTAAAAGPSDLQTSSFTGHGRSSSVAMPPPAKRPALSLPHPTHRSNIISDKADGAHHRSTVGASSTNKLSSYVHNSARFRPAAQGSSVSERRTFDCGATSLPRATTGMSSSLPSTVASNSGTRTTTSYDAAAVAGRRDTGPAPSGAMASSYPTAAVQKVTVILLHIFNVDKFGGGGGGRGEGVLLYCGVLYILL